MSGGFGLPVLSNLASNISGLGRLYDDAYEESARKTALSNLGQALQNGDYTGGAKIAFGAGDAGTGLGLLKLAEAHRKEKLTADADAEFAKSLTGGFGIGGPVGAPGGGPAPKPAAPSFLDVSGGPQGDYLTGLFRRESNFKTDAQAPTSSARGLGQFTERTWNATAQKYPDLNLTPVGGGQDGRTDPQQMIAATKALTGEHEDLLQRAGMPVTDATKYALHFLGAGGGRRLVAGSMRAPDAPATDYASPQAVAANRGVFFDRGGRAKSTSEVMNDFARSFGGGGGGQPPQVPQRTVGAVPDAMLPDYSAGLGGVGRPSLLQAPQGRPQQQAGYDPRADLPAPGAQEASGYFVPPPSQGSVAALPPGLSGAEPRPPGTPGSPQPQRQFPAPSDPAQVGGTRAIPPTSLMPSSSNPTGPVPQSYGGGVPGGRVMTMPGEGPVPTAQGDAAAASPADRAYQARLNAVAQQPLGERIPFLLKAIASPYLSDGPKEVAKLMYKQAIEETSMPPAIKEFRIARGLGYTQANTPTEYAAEQARAKSRDPGQDLQSQIRAREAEAQRLGLTGDEGRNYVLGYKPPSEKDDGAKITAQIEARKAAAPGLGLQEGTPAWRSYVATGKVGADRDMSVTEKKAIGDADNAIISSQSSIGMLQQAKDLSAKAYAGPLANARGAIAGYLGSEAGQATQELDNLVTTNALTQLKSIFGGNPTEGERKILLDIQGSSNLPHALRIKVYDRAIAAAELRMQQNLDRRTQIQDGTYYRPGGGASVTRPGSAGGGQQAPAGASPDARALPAPSPSNRPGAVSAGDRFGQLVGSGMSKAQAYQQLHSEGY